MVVTQFRIYPFLVLPIACLFGALGVFLLVNVGIDVLVDGEAYAFFQTRTDLDPIKRDVFPDRFAAAIRGNSIYGITSVAVALALLRLHRYWRDN